MVHSLLSVSQWTTRHRGQAATPCLSLCRPCPGAAWWSRTGGQGCATHCINRKFPQRKYPADTVVPITGVTRATTTVMVDTGQAGNKTCSALPPFVVPPGRTPLSFLDTSLKLVLPPRSVRLNVKSGSKFERQASPMPRPWIPIRCQLFGQQVPRKNALNPRFCRREPVTVHKPFSQENTRIFDEL